MCKSRPINHIDFYGDVIYFHKIKNGKKRNNVATYTRGNAG